MDEDLVKDQGMEAIESFLLLSSPGHLIWEWENRRNFITSSKTISIWRDSSIVSSVPICVFVIGKKKYILGCKVV